MRKKKMTQKQLKVFLIALSEAIKENSKKKALKLINDLIKQL